MNDNQQHAQPAFPSFLGALGIAGMALLACMGGGFVLAAVLTAVYYVVYQVVAAVIYVVRHLARMQQLNRELVCARAAAGVLGLPEAKPAAAARFAWSARSTASVA